MADEQEEGKGKKTISLTPKQAGISAGAVGLLLALQPFIKSMVHDEIQVSNAKITSLELQVENLVKSHDVEIQNFRESNEQAVNMIVSRMERGFDDTVKRIEAVESRGTKVTDHLQKQIDDIIASRLKSRAETN